MTTPGLRRLLDLAEAAGIEAGVLRDAATELVHVTLRISELERSLDRRVIIALENSRKVMMLAGKGLSAAAITKRTGIPKSSVYRYLKEKPTAV